MPFLKESNWFVRIFTTSVKRLELTRELLLCGNSFFFFSLELPEKVTDIEVQQQYIEWKTPENIIQSNNELVSIVVYN